MVTWYALLPVHHNTKPLFKNIIPLPGVLSEILNPQSWFSYTWMWNVVLIRIILNESAFTKETIKCYSKRFIGINYDFGGTISTLALVIYSKFNDISQSIEQLGTSM